MANLPSPTVLDANEQPIYCSTNTSPAKGQQLAYALLYHYVKRIIRRTLREPRYPLRPDWRYVLCDARSHDLRHTSFVHYQAYVGTSLRNHYGFPPPTSSLGCLACLQAGVGVHLESVEQRARCLGYLLIVRLYSARTPDRSIRTEDLPSLTQPFAVLRVDDINYGVAVVVVSMPD